MIDTTGESRTAYRPSGKVDWFKLVPGLLVAGTAAIAMAWCLSMAFRNGFYLIFIAPFFAALAVAGVWYLVLTWSHCRNKVVATLASVALGLLLYFGYYHICLLQLIGLGGAHRIDMWPRYVQFRMRTDVARDVHHHKDKNALLKGPDPVQRAFNWFFFGVELASVIAILAAVGRHCASKAYCESCSTWMKSETLKLPPGQGATVWDSLQRGDFAAVQQQLAGTSRQGSISGSLTIEHCPHCPAENRSNTVYLTVNDIPVPGTPDPIAAKVGSMFKPRHTYGLRTHANHVELHPEEVGALAKSFPSLKSTIEANPNLFAEVHSAAREIDRAVEVQADEWTERVARVEAVEASDAGTILTRKNAIMQTIIAVVTAFGGFALALAPAGVISTLDHEPPDWVSATALVWMFGCMLINLGWLLCFARYPTSRFMLRQTRHAFELRPNPAVGMNDPDLFFVDIIPRINWGKQMMENATDIGFLQLDKTRRELRFEGDRERYWIPAESILEIKHEFWAESVQHQLQKAPSLNHVIVVRAMTASGPWETWFYSRQYKFRPLTEKRRLADALELESKIRELV